MKNLHFIKATIAHQAAAVILAGTMLGACSSDEPGGKYDLENGNIAQKSLNQNAYGGKSDKNSAFYHFSAKSDNEAFETANASDNPVYPGVYASKVLRIDMTGCPAIYTTSKECVYDISANGAEIVFTRLPKQNEYSSHRISCLSYCPDVTLKEQWKADRSLGTEADIIDPENSIITESSGISSEDAEIVRVFPLEYKINIKPNKSGKFRYFRWVIAPEGYNQDEDPAADGRPEDYVMTISLLQLPEGEL